jgi:WD40 repeat protein
MTVRRPHRAAGTIAATTVAAVVLAACGAGDGDDSAPSMDMADIEASYGEIVRSKGTVLGVSVHGQVVREGGDGAWCVVDLDGAYRDCWPVDQRVEPATVQWSPDGSMVAFDGRIDRMSGFDSDVRVLDVASGEIATIADDGRDDAGAPHDLLPAWVDEDRLAFLRDRHGQLELVHAQVGGDTESADIDSLELPGIVSRNAAVLDGGYAVAAGRGPIELVRIDRAGEVRTIADLTGSGAEITGTSRDHEQVVVASAVDGDRLTPVVHVAGDTTTSAPFTASSAAVSPDGRLVAAAGTDGGGITLWDPAGDDSRRLDPPQTPIIEAPVRLVWADDDRLVLWSPSAWQVVTLSG